MRVTSRFRAASWILLAQCCVLGLPVVALMSGCIKSYVDPGLKNVEYTSLKAPSSQGGVSLTVEFQTFGKRSALATSQARKRIQGILERTGLFSSVQKDPTGQIPSMAITINNTGDLGDAAGKGFVTGLTFGLAGSMVTDFYEFKGTYNRPGSAPVVKEYKGAIHSTVGLKDGPEGLEPMSTQKAFDTLVERLVLNWLADLQREGAL